VVHSGPIARIEDLCKSYRMGAVTVEALRGLSLDFNAGEYVTIMGPSGCGKSTLLNLLGCLDRPSSGQYYLGGEDVSQLSDDDLSAIRGARIGFIFQSYNLIQQLSVLENIEVPLYYQGCPEHHSRRIATELAKRVGLATRVDHKPVSYTHLDVYKRQARHRANNTLSTERGPFHGAGDDGFNWRFTPRLGCGARRGEPQALSSASESKRSYTTYSSSARRSSSVLRVYRMATQKRSSPISSGSQRTTTPSISTRRSKGFGRSSTMLIFVMRGMGLMVWQRIPLALMLSTWFSTPGPESSVMARSARRLRGYLRRSSPS